MKIKLSNIIYFSIPLLYSASAVFGENLDNHKEEAYPLSIIGFVGDAEEDRFTTEEGYYYLSRKFDTKATMPETLSDKQDVQGNWGPPIDGLQLSIRVRQTEFVRGQPVMAVVIMRNLSPDPRTLLISDDMWQFALSKGTNVFIWKKTLNYRDIPVDNGMFSYTIKPRGEGLIAVHVNRFFNVDKQGEYSIEAKILTQARASKSMTNVVSGHASFKIVNRLSPADDAVIEMRNKQIKTIEQKISHLGQ